jgi:hypothetical protein
VAFEEGSELGTPHLPTVRHRLAWTYANLARAHAALAEGCANYRRSHHIVRSRLYSGLMTGRMSMRSMLDDEIVKLTSVRACAYCGAQEHLSVDHLIPRNARGSDESGNLVIACRTCNSSKKDEDLLRWMARRGSFPSIFVLRRYLKLAHAIATDLGLLDEDAERAAATGLLTFDPLMLPERFPPLDRIRLHAEP